MNQDDGQRISTSSAAAPDPLADPDRPATLARTIGGGASWLLLGTIASKIATTVAQVVLGWLLTQADFGLFATAAAVGSFVGILRDGGATTILVQRGAKEYQSIAGPLFWLCFAMNSSAALLMVALAYPLEAWTDKPGLASLLLVMALATPIQVPGAFLHRKLQVEMRFGAYTQILTISAILRQVATIALAFMGFGAMSFAWPWVICAVYEAIATYRLASDAPWKRAGHPREWIRFLRDGIWIMVGSAANLMLDLGVFLVLGLMVVKEVVGIFWFAFQITAQMAVLLGFAMQQILTPVMAKLNAEPERKAEAIVRALRAQMLIGSIACVGLGVAMDPLEKMVWHGKWDAAVVPVMILGVFFPWRITFGLTTAVLQGAGKYKYHSIATLIEGLCLIAATAGAVLLHPSPNPVVFAWAAGVSLMVTRLVVTVLVLGRFGVGIGRTLAGTLPSWLLAVGSGAIAVELDRRLGLGAVLRSWCVTLLGGGPGKDLSSEMLKLADMLAQGARAVLVGATCGVLFALAARLALVGDLRDAARVAPGPIGRVSRAVLRLGDA